MTIYIEVALKAEVNPLIEALGSALEFSALRFRGDFHEI